MISEWESSGEHYVPFVIKYDYEDFPAMIEKVNSYRQTCDRGWVHHSSYWLVDEENQILGCSNIRHYLNHGLLNIGGHIGYGVKPSARRKGCATKMLELSLQQAGRMGITKALLSCDKSNIASAKTIQKNGGIKWRELMHEDELIEQYWIDID